MATGTPTIDRPLLATSGVSPSAVIDPLPSGEAEVALAPLGALRSCRLWREVDSILRKAGQRPSNGPEATVTEVAGPERTSREQRRIVAPGIVVSAEEYEQRFSGIDLAA